jgi:hypothetical protein
MGRPSKYIPIVGKKYGDWVVVSDKVFLDIKNLKRYKVQCQICQSISHIIVYHLENGKTLKCKKCSDKGARDSRIIPIGTKYGLWEVVGNNIPRNKWNQHNLKVKCECGTITVQAKCKLVYGHTKGCWKCLGERKTKSYYNLSLSYFNATKTGAIRRGLSFNVTPKDLWDKFIEQEGKCALSGEKIELVSNYTGRSHSKQTASPDRIDSTKGYEKDNIQWVHKDLNMLKQNRTDQEFIELCHKVSKYQSLKYGN